MKAILRLSLFPLAVELQTLSLFLLDGLANVIDFGFHFWMGRVLVPSEFAVLQTLNAVLLVYVTASGVFQPVVGRFVAEARGRGEIMAIPALFESFFCAALWVGFGLGIIFFLLAAPIAQLLNLPKWTIQVSAALIFLGMLRPVAVGVLQGQERFTLYGLSRLLTAAGRLLFAILFVMSGFGLYGAVAAFPLGWLAGVVAAFFFLGKSIWMKDSNFKGNHLREGWQLSAYALVAYFAFMSLASIDLVWVNRTLSGEAAGAYASLVLLRRIVALLPGAAVVVMFPRIAKTLAQGQLPDRLLSGTAMLILTACGLLTGLYFLFSRQLVSLLFGEAYFAAVPLLGWMGFAMTGLSLSSIWLNFYLAHKPGSFVMLLLGSVILEGLLLNFLPPTMQNALIAFGTTGWLLFAGGLLLYLVKFRGELAHA